MANKKFFTPKYEGETDDTRKASSESFKRKADQELKRLDPTLSAPEKINTDVEINFEPLGDNILLIRDSGEVMSAGGIIVIPKTVTEVQNTGIVKAIGGEVKKVKVGDTILFPKHKGAEIELEGIKMTIVSEKNDVIGICRPKKDKK